MKKQLATLGLGLGLGLLSSAVLAADPPAATRAIVSGTPHEALFSIAFYDDVGIAVGAGGAVLESADGGNTWKWAPPVTQLSLMSTSVNQGTALAVGQLGVILRMDGDGKWRKVDSGTQSRLLSVKVNAHGGAVAAGAFGTVLKSDDGGEHWASIAPASWSEFAEQEPHLYLADIDDDGVVTIGGEYGLLLRSGDGGAHWQVLHKGEASLFSMQLRADGSGYAVGQNGTVLRTADHGTNWDEIKVDTSANLLGVCAAADGHVVVTGMHDMLLSNDNGGTWRHQGGEEVLSSWYAGTATPPAGAGILAVGHSGQIVRITD